MADRAFSTRADARAHSKDISPATLTRRLCASWRASRAAAHFYSAAADGGDDYTQIDDTREAMDHRDAAREAIGRAEEMIALIATSKPEDVAAAAEMLDVAYGVLEERQRDPEARLAKGDVLAILRNVRVALGWAGAIPLNESGLKMAQEADRRASGDNGAEQAAADPNDPGALLDACRKGVDAHKAYAAAARLDEDSPELAALSERAREQVEIAIKTPARTAEELKAKASLMRCWLPVNRLGTDVWPHACEADRLAWSLTSDVLDETAADVADADLKLLDLCARHADVTRRRDAAEDLHENTVWANRNPRKETSPEERDAAKQIDKAAQALFDEQASLREKIILTQPRTKEGAIAKAAAAALAYGAEEIAGTITQRLRDDDIVTALCFAAVRDVAAHA